MKLQLSTSLLLSIALLTACNKPADKAGTPEEAAGMGAISNTMDKVTEEARNDILKGNMSLGRVDGHAKGEITPKGDLLIDGKAVTVTAEQRQLLIRPRELLTKIAISGVEIGMQGVDLAKKAVGESIKGIFNGESDQVEKKVEAEAKKIEASATVLCEQLPLLLESQQTLAASLPEFKPYATMTKDDIDDCHGKVVDRK